MSKIKYSTAVLSTLFDSTSFLLWIEPERNCRKLSFAFDAFGISLENYLHLCDVRMWCCSSCHISGKQAARKLLLCQQLRSAVNFPALCAVLHFCSDGDTVFFLCMVLMLVLTHPPLKPLIKCCVVFDCFFFFPKLIYPVKGIKLHYISARLWLHVSSFFQFVECRRDSPFHQQTMRSCQAAASISHVWRWARPCHTSNGCWALRTSRLKTTCPLDGTSWSSQMSASLPTTHVWPCQLWGW